MPIPNTFKCLQKQLGLDVDGKDKHGNTPLHIAAASNHLAVVLQLLKLGANKDAKDGNGKTAYELAPKYNKQMQSALE